MVPGSEDPSGLQGKFISTALFKISSYIETDIQPINNQTQKQNCKPPKTLAKTRKTSRENLHKRHKYIHARSRTDPWDKLVHQMACAIFVMLTGLVPEIC